MAFEQMCILHVWKKKIGIYVRAAIEPVIRYFVITSPLFSRVILGRAPEARSVWCLALRDRDIVVPRVHIDLEEMGY